MPLVILLGILLISAWFFSEVLVFLPLHFFAPLKSVLWYGLLFCGFLAFSWIFGD